MKLTEMLYKTLSASENLTPKDYHESRKYFILEACTGSTVFNLTTGAFMAGFALFMGADDNFAGLLAALPSLANAAQIISPLILERLSSRKAFVTIVMNIYRSLLGLTFFIPFFIADTNMRLTVLFVVSIIGFLCLSFSMPGFSIWLMNMVPVASRGRFFGIKDSYALATVTVIALLMGKTLDIFKAKGMEYLGFITISIVALILTVINIATFLKIKEPVMHNNTDTLKLRDMLLIPLRNKRYMKMVTYFILWNFGFYIANPYLSIYIVKYLKLDYTYIQLLGLVTTGTMIVAVRLWGRFADRYSWSITASSSMAVLVLSHLLWVFTSSSTMFLLPVIYLFSGIAMGGINMALFNLPFQYAPDDARTVYLGFNATISGLIGYAGTVTGGRIAALIGDNPISVAGFEMAGIQLLFLVSSAIILLAIIFAVNALQKQPSS